MAENELSRNNILKKVKHNYLLSGLVFCGECNSLLEIESSKRNTYHYYRHPQGSNHEHCQRKRWSAKIIEPMVVERIHQLVTQSELFDVAVDYTHQQLNKETVHMEQEIHLKLLPIFCHFIH